MNLFTFFKRLFFFLTPFIVLLLVYILCDPYMVIFKYDDYNKNSYVHKNLDYITTEKYLHNSEEVDYNSFTFGGSTALYISPTTWVNYLGMESVPYSFVASGEHINGIWSKIKFLHANNNPLDNILLVFDIEATFGHFIDNAPMAMKHYKIYPTSPLNFHYRYFLDFINVRFLVPYLHFRLTNRYHQYMEGALLNHKYHYDPISNEYYNTEILDLLKTDSLSYYENRINRFGIQAGSYIETESRLNPDYFSKLQEIRGIFDACNTNYKILIGPTYNQRAFCKEDLVIMEELFGNENIFDFSGINEISKEKSNFYDDVHFKKYVGDEMLNTIYSEGQIF